MIQQEHGKEDQKVKNTRQKLCFPSEQITERIHLKFSLMQAKCGTTMNKESLWLW